MSVFFLSFLYVLFRPVAHPHSSYKTLGLKLPHECIVMYVHILLLLIIILIVLPSRILKNTGVRGQSPEYRYNAVHQRLGAGRPGR